MPHIRIASIAEVPDGGCRAFDVEGQSLLICRIGMQVFAVENRCSHNGLPLEGGRLRGHYLICPTHGARFDLRDGSTAGALTKAPIRTFETHVEGTDLYLVLRQTRD